MGIFIVLLLLRSLGAVDKESRKPDKKIQNIAEVWNKAPPNTAQ